MQTPTLDSAPETENVESCPLCGSEDSKFLFWNYDRLHLLPGKFGLVRCSNCTLVRLTPRPIPEKLGFYYPEDDYYSYQTSGANVENIPQRGFITPIRDGIRASVLNRLNYPTVPLKSWQKTLQPLFWNFFRKPALYGRDKLFPRYVTNGSALDIGCGGAMFLSYLKHHGWQVKGVDISETAAKTAKKVYDIDVFVGGVEDAPFASESFDFIRMSHVIEHLPYPLETMRHISSLLKPEGVLYIETPNIDCFELEHCDKYWFPLETPRHLFLFSPVTLEKLLGEVGLRIKQIETSFFAIYDWEDTYRIEEKTQSVLPERPKLSLPAYPRAIALMAKSRLKHLFDKTNGNIIECWVTKVKSS